MYNNNNNNNNDNNNIEFISFLLSSPKGARHTIQSVSKQVSMNVSKQVDIYELMCTCMSVSKWIKMCACV